MPKLKTHKGVAKVLKSRKGGTITIGHPGQRHNTGKKEWEFDERMLKAVCVFKLVVEEMSCKEHE